MPRFLNPAEWLAAMENLPRVAAVMVVIGCLSLLAFGLRGFKFYVCIGAGLGGWAGGLALGALMHVKGWYVAIPTAMIAAGVAYPLGRFAGPVVVGFVSACGLGTLVAHGLGLGGFWVAFSVGLFAGVVFAVLASRFSIALFCAAAGTFGALASLGAAVRAESGWLSPGGYVRHPVASVIIGAMLFVGGLIVQVAMEPEFGEDAEWDPMP